MRTPVLLSPIATTVLFLLSWQAIGTPPTSRSPHRIAGLWLMGQSLCDGSDSLPLVTTSPSTSGALMFRRGVRTWVYGEHSLKPETRPAPQFSFVPLAPAVNGGLGETIANGLADHL